MIFIYNDYGGTHTTSLVAAYHLKKLPTDRTLTKEEIINVDYFNKLTKHDFGKLIFHGLDEDGNAVYTIGRKNDKYVVPALQNFSTLLQKNYNLDEKIILSNTSPTVPIAMTIGGLFSRGLHIDFIGVPLLITGAKQCCGRIKRLVEHTKKVSCSRDSKIIVLENKSYK
ncbi:DUF3189 family protein [Lentibacillus sp. L22]|uniref:DUF3189 family protein n=1 Tax=Lentibacillus TaxID=175304 RepID=UPI0022B0E7C3|nr:DUF3189 family protein [Lentibacillus daqui]